MSPADQAAYRAALDPWKRKAERERKVIAHVRYRDGRADVVLIPRKEAEAAKEPPGSLL